MEALLWELVAPVASSQLPANPTGLGRTPDLPDQHQAGLAGHRLDRGADHDQEITTKTTRQGTSRVRHLFITTIRKTPEALLRLIRQRWSLENEGTRSATPSSVRTPHAYTRHARLTQKGRLYLVCQRLNDNRLLVAQLAVRLGP